MKCKDCKAICALRDQSSTGERECAYQAQIVTRTDPIDWLNFRCIAAKDILCAIISTDAGYQSILIDNGNQQRIGENVVSNAIFMANELIEQLQKQ